MIITSTANKHIKEIVALQEKKERQKNGLFLIEGERELQLALDNNYEVIEVLYCREILKNSDIIERCGVKTEVTANVFAKIAYRENSDGFVAVARRKERFFSEIVLPAAPLVLVLEKIEKPGNIGAILRTADAAGVDLVIISEPLTDLYNPNIVRASLGAIFSVPTVEATNQEALTWLKEKNFSIITTTPSAQKNHFEIKMTKATAIVVGSEKDGVSDFWLKNATEKSLIPMMGSVNSLNASVSAAIVVYEAVRQRQK